MFYQFLLVTLLLMTPFVFGDEIHRRKSYSQMNLSPNDKMLFILHAQDGHLEQDGSQRNRYRLTLYNVSRDVTFFTERPARKAGRISIEQFLKIFGQEKPNAGLVSSLGPKRSRTHFSDIPVTLINPRYDKENDRMTIDVEILGRNQRVQTGDLGPTTLFIDDFGPYPGG